ncbi:MAG TPA: hypothetical protein VG944_01235, partial [Fimbriimonas sp.]|nr:hypothetical protein [Fimbriimonas sp.]
LADSRPSLIRANQYQTNVGLGGDDSIDFELDLSGSGRDFNTFSVNPKGATNIELAGGRAGKREWAGEFQAAARITTSGWEAELRIPWREMKLPSPGPRDVRFNFQRNIARTGREFGAFYRSVGGVANTPVWRSVAVPRGETDRSIKLLPYTYLGYDPSIGAVVNSGLDLKAALNDKVQLVGSINPDFRNIENQILSLDFSRFARLAGETRPFFLEGSEYEGSGIFASQVIPRFDLGVNAYGKLSDRLSFGVLDTTQYGIGNELVASSFYALDNNSSARLSATDYNADGVHNGAYQMNYRHGWGLWALNFQNSESYDSSVGQGDSSNVRLIYRSPGVFVNASYSRVGANYLPRLGFVPEVDYEGFRGGISYDRPWNKGAMSEAGVFGSYLVYDHTDGSPYRRDASFSGYTSLRNGLTLSLDQDYDQFEGVNDHLTSVEASYPANDPYDQIATSYSWGEEALLPYSSLSVSGSRRLFRRLQLTASYQLVNYDGINDQLICGANWDIGHDQSIYGRLTEQSGQIGGYFAYRRSGNLGAEYYLIVGDPNANTFRPSVILKVVVPLEIGSTHRVHPLHK